MRHPHENNNEPVDFVAVVDVVLAVTMVVLEELRGCAILLNLRPTGIERKCPIRTTRNKSGQRVVSNLISFYLSFHISRNRYYSPKGAMEGQLWVCLIKV